MTTPSVRERDPMLTYGGNGFDDTNPAVWRDRTRLVLTPTAPPSILGLFGFSAATFVVAAFLAHWYGNGATPLFLFPFVTFTGGLAQLVAGFFAYRARDGLATAMHGIWGAFWLSYGMLYLLDATGAIRLPTGVDFPALGFWFIALGAITWFGALAALRVSIALFGVLFLLAAGSTLLAIGYLSATSAVVTIGGYVLVGSAVVAWYTAGAMMLEGTFRRTILPLGTIAGGLDVPGRVAHDFIEYPVGMPGAHAGQ